MNMLRDKRKSISLAVDFTVATAVAVGLVVEGLPELAWMPYFLVAATSGRSSGCLARLRGARS